MKLSPLIKGLITAGAMILLTMIIYYTNAGRYTFLGYGIYILYALGITWTLLAYSRSEEYTGKFGDSFQKGFRTFIVVTLVMVAFTFVLFYLHPEWAVEGAQAYREHLVKEGNSSNTEIEAKVAAFKKGFVTSNVSGAVFGYLMTGAIFTAIGAALITARKK